MTSHPSNAGQVPPLRPKIESQSTPPIFRLDQYRYCYDLNHLRSLLSMTRTKQSARKSKRPVTTGNLNWPYRNLRSVSLQIVRLVNYYYFNSRSLSLYY